VQFGFPRAPVGRIASGVPCAFISLICLCFLAVAPLRAADFEVIKVLPHLLDQNGRHTDAPSLFARDAYQDWLRANPDRQSAIRYDIQWRARQPGEYTLKLELLGRVEQGRPNRTIIESKVTRTSSRARWSALSLSGEAFTRFGAVVAWRASLWQGDRRLATYQSFLWE